MSDDTAEEHAERLIAHWEAYKDRAMFWILDERNNPVPVTTPDAHMVWSRWRQRNRHRTTVANTTLEDGTWISTIFLGSDMHWGMHDEPAIYETMVFADGQDEPGFVEPDWHHIQMRYATPYQARVGHVGVIKAVKEMQEAVANGKAESDGDADGEPERG